jgi:hypothetical protein
MGWLRAKPEGRNAPRNRGASHLPITSIELSLRQNIIVAVS